MSATLATLVNFNGADGANLRGDLTADSNGDLFGTTSGTVFEIAKTPTGYASTPTTLVTFDGGYKLGRQRRPDRRCQRRPVRDDSRRRRGWLRHSVRDRQDPNRLRQRADHAGQLQRNERRILRRRA